ncbi:UDP-glucosyltransferase 2-like [Uranotaenia lowii]|uniref:UDP-glucosyltransferase 2-like n=1 Tax=Uranotaenia lowii TaxID=190385 RepID=UPI002478E547|nr:UDP-glucosyltransferase 2-like [Uranotaenia lowii]
MNSKLIVFITFLVKFSLSANVLILSGVPAPSHSLWFKHLAHSLALKGHNVTVLCPDIERKPPTNVSYIHLENLYSAFYNSSQPNLPYFFHLHELNPLVVLEQVNEFSIKCCKLSLISEGFHQLLNYPKDYKFDVVIADYMNGGCVATAIMHRFRNPPLVPAVPYNTLSTSTPLIGSFVYSSMVPNYVFDVTQEMSFWQRAKNFVYDSYDLYLKMNYVNPQLDVHLRKLFPRAPSTKELSKHVKLLLINANHLIEYQEPMMPSVVPVGGMHIKKPDPLPADLQQIVSNATNGFVLFSLGSNARSEHLGQERIRAILVAMKSFPKVQFIWKFESDESSLPIPLPENVFIRPWLPQQDLLAQSNARLFITHSGLLSIQEAIWYGVPIIGIPLFTDQFRNINYCESAGIAKRLSVPDLTNSTKFVETMRETLEVPSYLNKMKRLSRMFRDQPEHPMDRAVWWVEWVIRNPDAKLQSKATTMGWLQKYQYDVLLSFILALVVVLFVIVVSIHRIYRSCDQVLHKQKVD